jgi:altronate hydrolase
MSESRPQWTALRIHSSDNVICLLRDHEAGERPLADGTAASALTSAVPSGHKVALVALAKGDLVVKFGHAVGRVTHAIAPGDHVHLHNLEGLTEAAAP